MQRVSTVVVSGLAHTAQGQGLHGVFICTSQTQKSIIEWPQRLFTTGKFSFFSFVQDQVQISVQT